MTTTNDLCSICLAATCGDEPCHTLACSHKFHTSCIVQSLRYDSRCPMCRDEGRPPKTLDEFSDDEWFTLMSHVWRRMRRRRNALARKNDRVMVVRTAFWSARSKYRTNRRQYLRKRHGVVRKHERLVEKELRDDDQRLEQLETDMNAKQMAFESISDSLLY